MGVQRGRQWPAHPPGPIQLEKTACHCGPRHFCPPLIQPSKLTPRLGWQLLAKSPKQRPAPPPRPAPNTPIPPVPLNPLGPIS